MKGKTVIFAQFPSFFFMNKQMCMNDRLGSCSNSHRIF